MLKKINQFTDFQNKFEANYDEFPSHLGEVAPKAESGASRLGRLLHQFVT